jgi:hypothetical protein
LERGAHAFFIAEAAAAGDAVDALLGFLGSVANFSYGYNKRIDVRLSCCKDGELLGDGLGL